MNRSDTDILLDANASTDELVAAARRNPGKAMMLLDNAGYLAKVLAGDTSPVWLGPTLNLQLLDRHANDGINRRNLLRSCHLQGVIQHLRRYPANGSELLEVLVRIPELSETEAALATGALSTQPAANDVPGGFWEAIQKAATKAGKNDIAEATSSWLELLQRETEDAESIIKEIDEGTFYESDLALLATGSRCPEIQAALVRTGSMLPHLLSSPQLIPEVAIGAALYCSPKLARLARAECERRGWPISMGATRQADEMPIIPSRSTSPQSSNKVSEKTAVSSQEEKKDYDGWDTPLWPGQA